MFCVDANDYRVVGITARMLADDVERVTGKTAKVDFQVNSFIRRAR